MAAAKEKAQGSCGGSPAGEVAVPTAAYGDAVMEETAISSSTTAISSPKGTAIMTMGWRSHLLDPLSAAKVDDVRVAKRSPSCRSFPSLVHLVIIFIVMLCTAGAVSADSNPCEVASLATNIRLFCSSNHPTSLCCDSINAAVFDGGKECLCMVGSSTEIITMGLSSESLIRIHNICSQHEDDFDCDGERDNAELQHNKSADDEAASRDYIDEDPRRQRNHRTHGYEMNDDRSEEAVYSSNPRTENIADVYPQPQQHAESSYSHTSSSATIGIMSTIIVVLVVVLGTAATMKFKRHQAQRDLRQVLSVALAAALPPMHAQGAVATHAAPAPAPAPPVQPPPPPQPQPLFAPGMVNGHPIPQAQAPPLALFPGPAEIVSLLGSIMLERMRRRVGV